MPVSVPVSRLAQSVFSRKAKRISVAVENTFAQFRIDLKLPLLIQHGNQLAPTLWRNRAGIFDSVLRLEAVIFPARRGKFSWEIVEEL